MIAWQEIDFRRTPVTLTVAAVIVAIEIVSNLDPSRREFFFGDLRLGMWVQVWSGELWRPLTATLLHVNLFHAAFNVYWLLAFGQVLERYFGPVRFAAIFVLLAYVSSMTSFLVGNWIKPLGHTGIGLSGVGYGLFGLLWVGQRWRYEFRYACSKDLVVLFIGWFFVCILLTYSGAMRVDNYGHAAGLAFGAMYGMAAFSPRYRYVWLAAAVVLSTLVLTAMIAAPGHPAYEAYRELLRLKGR